MQNLRTYLERTATPQTRFAAIIGISRGYMSQLVSGTKTPSLELAAAIERATDGAVTAASWVPPRADEAA